MNDQLLLKRNLYSLDNYDDNNYYRFMYLIENEERSTISKQIIYIHSELSVIKNASSK